MRKTRDYPPLCRRCAHNVRGGCRHNLPQPDGLVDCIMREEAKYYNPYFQGQGQEPREAREVLVDE